MQQSVTFSQFVDAFRAHDRQDQFSYDALRVLFDELQDYEEQTGSEVELDVIALCCDFVEMDWDEFKQQYGLDFLLYDPDEVPEDEQKQAAIEWLIDQTWFMGETKDGSFVFQQF